MPKATRHPVGCVIELWWDSDNPPVFVKGHVDEADFKEACERYGIDSNRLERIEHKYARWSQTAKCRNEGWNAELDDSYTEPGRGRFPITKGFMRKVEYV